MTHILVVFTGGTIGAQLNESDVLNVVRGQTYRLINDYQSSGRRNLTVDVVEPINILSENARPNDWTRIARAVLENVTDEHAGVIVTHGTDTLAYASAALSFALAGLPKPVVLVASDLPLDDPSANGLVNFGDAVELIAESAPRPGVFVTYRNPDGRRLVHAGSRTIEPSQLSHFVYSEGDPFLAEFVSDTVIKWLQYPAYRDSVGFSDVSPTFSEDVILLKPHPGLDYSRIDLSGCVAVVHGLFHSGTASASPLNKFNILDFARRCLESGISMFCAPIPGEIATYESSREFVSSGITLVPQMRTEVAYVKTSLGAGMGLRGQELERYVARTHIADEFI